MSKPIRRLATVAFTAGLVVAFADRAEAQSTIKTPGDHPPYSFEAEPHLAIDPYGPDGFGPGFRGTIQIVDPGFVTTINDTVGIGFGLDWLFYGDHCRGPRDRRECDSASDVFVPLVLQWNFWLHPRWSVFGEPGIGMRFRSGPRDDHFDVDPFVLFVGGRFHFNDDVALTLRLGAPFFDGSPLSIGVSFLL